MRQILDTRITREGIRAFQISDTEFIIYDTVKELSEYEAYLYATELSEQSDLVIYGGATDSTSDLHLYEKSYEEVIL